MKEFTSFKIWNVSRFPAVTKIPHSFLTLENKIAYRTHHDHSHARILLIPMKSKVTPLTRRWGPAWGKVGRTGGGSSGSGERHCASAAAHWTHHGFLGVPATKNYVTTTKRQRKSTQAVYFFSFFWIPWTFQMWKLLKAALSSTSFCLDFFAEGTNASKDFGY